MEIDGELETDGELEADGEAEVDGRLGRNLVAPISASAVKKGAGQLESSGTGGAPNDQLTA
ncbi:hypothetical protein AB4259_22400 [Vibrio amylolyticus]|uniref:hypothetical protein n=1 Tax=Vibrio TaxID=662 RepID=UPI00105608AA|nr:hypothetical protein [Vibrio sp. 10N.261.55.A7]